MKLEILECLPDKEPKVNPLLFIHGANHGAGCWKDNFLPYFCAKGYPSYAVSLRGHGKSEGREQLSSFSLSDYLEDILEVILPFKLKPVLIGHSMGGAIVQKIMHIRPDAMKAAVLMASVPPNGMRKDVWRIRFINLREIIQIYLFNDAKLRANYLAKLFFSRDLPVAKRDELLKLLQPESARARKELLGRIVPGSIKTRVPMLVLGSGRDYLFPEKTTVYTGKAYKTKPVIFPRVSHDMMLDPNWRAVADIIVAFLQAISKGDEGEKA